MKLLFVAEAYAPRFGGGVRYEVDTVAYFRSLGHEVDVVTVGETGRARIHQEIGGHIYTLARHFEMSSARLSIGMLPFLMKNVERYDLVHFNAPNPLGEISYWIARQLKHRTSQAVCSFHGEVVSAKTFSGLYNRWLLPSHLGACQKVIASSPNIVSSTPVLADLSNVVVIPYGIDTDKFVPRPDWTAEIPDRPLRFLFVGRLVRYKGLSVLLDALRSVEGTLDVVGVGPLDRSVKELVRRYNLDQRVFFRGGVTDSELVRYYQNTDVLVLPSIDRGESFGYVLAEAMACGACAISTELGTGTSYVNLHGETGMVVAPRDIEALASAMNTLSRDRTLLADYRAKAHMRAQTSFSRGRMLHETGEMYRGLGLKL